MKIGIFGGSFCPPHKGHERALAAFLRESGVSLCYVVPTGIPPHKKREEGISPEQRLELAKRAFLPISDSVRILDTELWSEEVSYTYLTLDLVQRMHPGCRIFLFAGSDQVMCFEQWRKADYILAHATLCTMARDGNEEALEKKLSLLNQKFGAQSLLLREKAFIISSSHIRSELQATGISHALSPKVAEYVTTEGLFFSRSGERGRILEEMEKALSPSRFSHTLGVEREVSRLSELISYERRDPLCLAALLHDSTKEWSVEQQLSFLREKGRLNPEDVKSPPVLHAFSAACRERERGRLSEREISAICYHTTGRRGMDTGEKILFLADFMEETRPHAVCRRVREDFYKNLPSEKEQRLHYLDRFVLRVLEETSIHLKEKHDPIHPLTLEAIEDLKERKSYDSH